MLTLASEPPDVLLSDDPAADYAERARVIAVGDVRLTADGEPITAPDDAWSPSDEELVVTDPDQRVQAVLDDGQVRVLVWLERVDLADVLPVPAWASADGRPVAEDGAGVRFPGGWPVEDRGPHGVGYVTYANPVVRVEAAVPATAVDQVWYAEAEPAPITSGVDRYLRGGTPIVDGPDGDVLATVMPDQAGDWTYWNAGVEVLDDRGEWLMVAMDAGSVAVRGWVRAEDTAPDANAGMGWCGGCSGGARCGGWGRSGDPTVLAGTLLRADDGAIVGVARMDLWVDLSEPAVDGARAFTWWTRLGEATLWVDGDALVDVR
jgi:hypothetical protein